MSGEKEVDGGAPFLLTSDERVNGFSIVADDHHNITLLKCGEPVAWFSAAVSAEGIPGANETLLLALSCKKGGNAYNKGR